MRDILTEDSLQINLKYGGIKTQQVYTNFFWMSNRADAVVLIETDRRINVFRMDAPPKSGAYYETLYRWSKGRTEGLEEIPSDGVCALWHWLMERDLTGFNWKTSMHNKSRQDLIGNTDSPLEIYFKEVMADYPYRVVTMKKIKGILGKLAQELGEDAWQFEDRKADRQLTKMLQQSGWTAGGTIRVNTVLIRYWRDTKTGYGTPNFVRNEIRKMDEWKYQPGGNLEA